MRGNLLSGAGPPPGVAVSGGAEGDEDPHLVGQLRAARSLGLAVLAALTVVLAVTGVALFFVYSPRAADVGFAVAEQSFANALRSIHRLAAWAAVFVAIGTGVVVLIERGLARRWFGASLGPLAALVAVAGLVSGLPLAWNQIGLRAVTVGTGLDGYEFLWRDEARFVLTRYGQVTIASLAASMVLHIVAGLSLAIAATMIWRVRNEAPTPLNDVERAERLARRRHGLRSRPTSR